MSLRKISSSKTGIMSARTLALAATIILSACASMGDISPHNAADTDADIVKQQSSAASIEAHDEDAALFEDLNKNSIPVADEAIGANIAGSTKEEKTADQEPIAPADSVPFYLAVGGESLGRVAYSLYGSRAAVKLIYEQNPDLRGQKKLTAEQKVFFDLDKLNPEPAYLTKNMIDQYKNELSEKVKTLSNISGEATTSVGRGETLQLISARLYGTTRYWTELYLLNKDKLGNYDKLPAGTVLTYHLRTEEQIAVHPKHKATKNISPEPAITEPALADSQTLPPAQDQPAQDNKVGSQQVVAPSQQNIQREVAPPQPQVSAIQMKPSEDREIVPAVRVAENRASSTVSSQPAVVTDYSSSNTRRIIYVALILAIALAAFYMTRPSKRAKNFDMLDITAENNTDSGISSRQKLHKDTKTQPDQKEIG